MDKLKLCGFCGKEKCASEVYNAKSEYGFVGVCSDCKNGRVKEIKVSECRPGDKLIEYILGPLVIRRPFEGVSFDWRTGVVEITFSDDEPCQVSAYHLVRITKHGGK